VLLLLKVAFSSGSLKMNGWEQCSSGLKQLVPGSYSEVIRELSAGPEQDRGFDTSLRC